MADKKKPVVARGKALERTAKELDELTSIDALMELAGEAKEEWRDDARTDANATLLDSKGIS